MIIITATITWPRPRASPLHGGLKHYHDEEMQSISLSTDKPLDPDKFFPWVQNLVQTEGPNILRCKGILSFKDDDERFVFQGVHMMLDGDHQRPWQHGREAREPHRVHRPQTAGGEDPRGLRRAAWRQPERTARECRTSPAIPPFASVDPSDDRAGRGRRAGGGRAFSWQARAVFVLGEEALLFVAARGEPAARCRARWRHPGDGGGCSAHPHRRRRWQGGGDRCRGREPTRSPPTPSIAGSITLRSGPMAPSPGRPASRPSCAAARASANRRSALDAPAGSRFSPKGFRLAVAHYNGVTLWFPNAQATPEGSNGKARISARCSRPTAAFSSPRCRSRCCTAGGLPTARTCACRAIRRRCAR